MFRCFLFIIGIFCCCLIILPLPNHAQETISSVISADLKVDTVIAVEVETPAVTQELSGTGEIELTASFLVMANTKLVDMFIETTALYLNAETANPEVDPIPLNESAGVEINPGGATPVDGDNFAVYIGNGDSVQGYPSRRTETISFDSSYDSTFNHSTTATVTWTQNDPSKPTGRYHGKIKLTCLVQTP